MSSHLKQCPSQWDVDTMKEGDTLRVSTPSFIVKLKRKLFENSFNLIKVEYHDDKYVNGIRTEYYDQRDLTIVSKEYIDSETNVNIPAMKTYKGKFVNITNLNINANVETISMIDKDGNGFIVGTENMKQLLTKIKYNIDNK